MNRRSIQLLWLVLGLGETLLSGASTEGPSSVPALERIVVEATTPDGRAIERRTAPVESSPESVLILKNNRRTVIFSEKGILLSDSIGHALDPITGIPSFIPLKASYTPTGDAILVLYQPNVGEPGPPLAASVLSFAGDGTTSWRELNMTPVTKGGTLRSPKLQPTWSFVAYGSGLALLVFALFWLRVRNRKLQALVTLRTKELAQTKDFLANLSHEISNPMNGVMGIAEAMKIRALDPDSQRKWRMLRQCACHLSSVLEDLRNFSYERFGPDKPESRPFDLPDLMASVVALTALESGTYDIPVEVALSPLTPQRLIGDERRLRQILVNFVTNAIKYSGQGKVNITVWRNQAAGEFAQVFFAVADDGPGIPSAEQEKIFARFVRSTNALLGRVPGSGLGLALCRTFAAEIGGKIWLKSTPGRGSCFYLSAPFATEGRSIKAEIHGSEITSRSPKLALVVDDEEYNRIALTGLLETHEISVISAANGSEAVALAKIHHFDFIFLDYSLPGLNGPEIARAIRALPNQSAEAAMLAITGSHLPEQQADWIDAGIDAFLHKPVSADRLRQSLLVGSTGGQHVRQSSSAPVDPLVNLRLLATKKRVPFANELTLYFDEFEGELKQLAKALQLEDSGRVGYYAHLLYGRCSFIRERDLEMVLRPIENAAASDDWTKVWAIHHEVESRLADLRIRLFSDRQVAQPA